MEIKEFAQMAALAVKDFMGKEFRTEVREITKNNGVKLLGLLIIQNGTNISPTIYMESFFEEYKNGRIFGDIVYDIVRLYEKNRLSDAVDMDFFLQYDLVKNRIFQKVVNYEENIEWLKKVPYRRFLDLAVVCYYSYMNDYIGSGSIQIENSHLRAWGIKEEMLFSEAGKNTMEKLGLEIISMEELLEEMFAREEESADADIRDFLNHAGEAVPMHIMTVGGRCFGAVCICYDRYLQEFAGLCKRNFYILPSSVHELIVIPDSGIEDPLFLEEMVREVNETHVAREERLSNHVYYFDIQNGRAELLKKTS